jgi:hypothetical protein
VSGFNFPKIAEAVCQEVSPVVGSVRLGVRRRCSASVLPQELQLFSNKVRFSSVSLEQSVSIPILLATPWKLTTSSPVIEALEVKLNPAHTVNASKENV